MSSSADSTILRLPAKLDIYSAEAIRGALLTALQAQPQLALDLSAVTECDAAGLQLLGSARRSAAAAGKLLTVTAGSTAIDSIARALGARQLDFQPQP